MIKLKHLTAAVAIAACAPALAAYHTTQAPAGPCKSHQLLSRTDRNQSSFFSQCGWSKRIKVSGLVKANFSMASDVWGGTYDLEDNNLFAHNGGSKTFVGNDFNHSLTFLRNIKDEGGLGLTMLAAANRNVGSANDLWLERAIVNVDASLSDWAQAHVSTFYWNDRNILNNVDAMMYNRYHGSWREYNGNHLAIDEASVDIGNLSQRPFYLRVGRQYGDFGWFDKNESVSTMTQLFSQGLHDAVQVGFVDVNNFSGSLSVFRTVDRDSIEDNAGAISEDRPEDNVNNFIVSLDYHYDTGAIRTDVKFDYMRDLFGSDFFDGYNGNGIIGGRQAGSSRGTGQGNIRPHSNTAAVAFTLKSEYSDFDGMFQWVGATEDLDKDIWTSGGDSTSGFGDTDVDGASPSAWLVEFGYSFPLLGRDSRVSLNYQRTHDAMGGSHNATGASDNYYIPERRYVVSVQHNLRKNVDVRLAYYRDKDYPEGHFQSLNNRDASGDVPGADFSNTSGTGNSNKIFLAELSARFN